VVRPGGPRCGCRAHGCLEAMASAAAIARRYTELTGRPVTGANEVVAGLGRDPAADRVWAEATSALADGLLTATTLLAPGGIVLGGGLAAAGDLLLAPVTAAMRARATAVTVPPLTATTLAGRAGVLGAALLARGVLTAG
jgi:glucokinase